ncbi:nicotinamidase-related amidase [Pseudomonas sp. SJZ079]|uniref:cysteine hydrolase family protein n=1 Tax=Pseudomonas sp. SJZ079 TaxID=2572887 RepID=UPI00119A837C|nr:cysteine hydrolase family protein [Pseudomonas sp. SJZ079]TWC36335.1 nicotinamidase-related amidase [Pseudomonas sp. SJZ079]
MPPEQLTRSAPAALLIIDMQQGIQRLDRPRNNPDAEAHIAALQAQWRAHAWPLVHIRHLSLDPASVFAPGQSGVLFQAALAPLEREQVFDKHVTDAFTHTGLERWLHARGLRRVVIVGVASENSVEATARSASNLGFTTQVVADACYTFAKPDYAGRPRSADEVHDMAMANLRDEYAQVLEAQELLTGPTG